MRLNSIILDTNKFKSIEYDLSTSSLDVCANAPWVRKEKSVKYYIRTYVKPIVDFATYKKLIFVDDSFAIFDFKSKCDTFFNLLNNQHKCLPFTVE